MKQFQQLSEHFFQEVNVLRCQLHRHPELSGREKNTAALIIGELEKMGIPYRSNVAGYGVVACLKGELEGCQTVALRADMDALPVTEKNDDACKSMNDGVMHACGHDFHVASLLGTLKILNAMRDSFGGTVKAIFQPSEEEYAGGAHFMIAENVLDEVKVIIGQHVSPEMKTGTIGLKKGPFMASTDEIRFTVTGKGGHAAMINEIVNPLTIAAKIIISLEEKILLSKPADIPTVLSFGRFIANGQTNVVPDTAEVAGTFRTFDEAWRQKALSMIADTANSVAKEYGASCETDIRKGYPVLVNDDEVTGRLRRYAQEFLGTENVLSLDMRNTAEDFAYYLQQVPGTFYRLGVSQHPENGFPKLHSSSFSVDENALRTSMGLMAWIAFNELKYYFE